MAGHTAPRGTQSTHTNRQQQWLHPKVSAPLRWLVQTAPLMRARAHRQSWPGTPLAPCLDPRDTPGSQASYLLIS